MAIPGVAIAIENDQDIRELIELVLRQAGFHVRPAESGAAGVESVRKYAPSLVTLDLGLPDIDGYDVVRQIVHSVIPTSFCSLRGRENWKPVRMTTCSGRSTSASYGLS